MLKNKLLPTHLGLFVMLAGTGMLVACASAPPKPVKSDCGCGSYTATKARPAWADREIASGDEYQSQGIAECTGIKSMDYADAEKRARENLGRVIGVQVRSEVLSVSKDDGMNGGASSSGQITSSHLSGVLLKSSEIFSHWVDTDACAVYAGVRISKADIDRAIQEVQAAEKLKMVNQRWRLIAEGQHADIITNQLGQALSGLGATRDTGSGAAHFVMSGAVNDVSSHNNQQMVRVSIKLEARNGSSVLWNRQIQGKGVSFTSESKSVLLKKAVQDAMENAKAELETFMQESVKQ